MIRVPSPVLVELDYLAGTRLGPRVFPTFLESVANGAIIIEDLIDDDYLHGHDLCIEYADLPLGFVDAAVFAIVERLNERKLATLDHRHFQILRPQHVSALDLLPALG